MGTGKTRGTGRNAHCNRRQDSNLRFPEGRSYPDSSDIGVRSGLCRYCGSQRGLLKTHAALPEFRLNDFDGIHSLMDGLLCVPLKETNPPPAVGVLTPSTSTDLNAEGETPLAVRRGVLKWC